METLKWELYYDHDKNEFFIVIGRIKSDDVQEIELKGASAA